MRFIVAICFIGCFFIHGFSLTIDELKNLDSAKIGGMILPELLDVSNIIDKQISNASGNEHYWDNVTGQYIAKPEDPKALKQWRPLQLMLMPQIISELKNLDSAKASTMNLAELKEAMQIMKRQADRILENDRIMNNGINDMSYTMKPGAIQKIENWHSVEAIAQSRIDKLYFQDYNAFAHLGSFYEYSGIVTLITGIAGLGSTIIIPATTKPHSWGWWMLPSGALSIVLIHLGITEIELGSDLKGYSARISIPVN
jgi:hypothetical protein